MAGGTVLACAKRPEPVTAPVPVPVREPVARIARAPLPPANPKLPPVPAVDGPLEVHVVYPREGALITSRDSDFIFGSVGNGQAGLRVNGVLVPVWPNGAFMGWIPNPPADSQAYTLVAYTATDTVRYVHRVRTLAALPPAPARHDTLIPVRPAQVATLRNDSLERFVSDTDRAIIGRPTPRGTYRWFLFPGTTVRVSGYLGDMAHVQLDDGQEIWVAREDAHVNGGGPAAGAEETQPLHVTRSALVPQRDWVDLSISVAAPPAYLVEESERGITLTLYNTTYNTTSATPTVAFDQQGDPYVSDVRMTTSPGRVTYSITCTRPIYGYLALYHDGVMTFRIRRPPTVDLAHPLRGQVVVVDPGHPPVGATGPTGLYEPVATLAVGLRVRDMLQARGATVVMTRTTPDPVALGDRPIMARRANGNALVSIHLNALPDGMNPFKSEGTGTYYFHPHSREFATLVQQALVPELGLRNLGIFRENLALVRPTWMPSVLTEGVFIIMPDQEAAIRTPQYQDAYARGIVNGLERFFATFAR